MIEPKFINKEDYNSKSLNYKELLDEGIELIQKFSGNQWSDYNYHDPGITFLEQICYALTDLGYKSNFPIEDILLAYTDKFDLENNNLLIPAEKIFPSSALTPFDYRKIIIDQEDTVKNAWVNPIKDNVLGISGIYDVLIQLKDNLSKDQIQVSLKNIENILMENRSLATDFNPITVLKKDVISLSADISINSFVLGESILADIYHKIESKLNKELKFYEYDELLQEGDFEAVFSGPIQKNKFIKDHELQRKTNEIYQYDIKEIIQSIEGVISVNNLIVYKNGIKMYNDIIPFDHDCYPSLDKDYYGSIDNKLSFHRNDSSYEIDSTILTQLYDSIALNDKNTYFKRYKPKKIIDKGRFSQKNIEHYFTIQNELPSIYGLKEFEITSKSTPERKSQVNQLKAYLLLIEQVMANYLSQLVNVRNLFSVEVEDSPLQTYFNQIPDTIGDVSSVIGTDNDSFLEFLNTISESDKKLIRRKNQIIDHLLSRFGETYDTSLITKLDTSIFDDLSEYEVQLKSLKSKLNYSKEIVRLGRNRIKGFNYKLKHDQDQNISGLKQRLCIILNIENHVIKSSLDPMIETSEINKIKTEWKPQTIKIYDGPSISVLASENVDATAEEANFYCEDYDTLKSLFLYAHKRKSYRIIKTATDYSLLYNSPKHTAPVKVFQSESIKKSEKALLKVLEKFITINNDCESFFILENILLRPTSETNYQLLISSSDDQVILKSYFSTEFNQLRDLRDDIWVILLEEQNFSIEKISDSNKFGIVVYDLFNQPILRSEKNYNSKAIAKREKTKIIDYFVSKNESKTEVTTFSEISIANSQLNKFPEDFKYSNHINFVFPDWPVRFQNNEFKNLINETIQDYIPAHLSYDIFYLDFQSISVFESIYFKWLDHRLVNDDEKLELTSLQLIQLLMSYQSYVS